MDEERLRASWAEIALIAWLVALAPSIYAWSRFGGDGRLAIEQVPAVLVVFAIAFITAAVVAEALRRAGMAAVLVMALLLAWLAIDAMTLAVWLLAGATPYGEAVAPFGSLAGYGEILWVALAFGRFAWSLRAVSAPRRLVALPLAVALFAFPIVYLSPDRALWARDWSRDADARSGDRWAAATEEVFYKQPEVLARELAAVAPQRQGVVDVYFIGMAGHGYQDVFMREVDAVADLMRERFDAGGRVVKLVNNPKSLHTAPIASTTSLRAALGRLAARMDVAEDVLVLFLTSHGSETHRFSLDLWPLRFNELDPATLRTLLDESGIRNRVVVVSACYSGGFVEPLRGEHTLVVTAAAADRNSFGCGNENQWTYFGKAYFDEALRKTGSFTAAFEAATPVIEAREKAEEHQPSRPMMALGEGMRAKLAELEAQLASRRTGGEVTRVAMAGAAHDAGDAPTVADRAAVERYLDAAFSARLPARYREACLLNMRASSPDALLAKDPNAFGGFDRKSPHWPRLAAAWEQHAERACTRSNDPALLRATYAEQLAQVMAADELDAATKLLALPQVRRWYDGEVEANGRQAVQLAPLQAAIFEDSYNLYLADQRRIFEALQRERRR